MDRSRGGCEETGCVNRRLRRALKELREAAATFILDRHEERAVDLTRFVNLNNTRVPKFGEGLRFPAEAIALFGASPVAADLECDYSPQLMMKAR